MLPALNFGVTPVEAKEIVYQAVAYLGIGRVFPFMYATNDVLTARGIELPLPSQATSTAENRLLAARITEMQSTLERLNKKIERYEKVLVPIENELKNEKLKD